MAYTTPPVIPADFHVASVKWWATGITLETTDISDANLTALIAEMAQRFDEYTDDHFERLTGSAISCTANSGTDAFTASAHGLANGWTVQIGGTPPGGTSVSTDYYVVGATANTFQVSLTSGGAAVDLSSNGSNVTVTSQTTTILVDSSGGAILRVPNRMRSIVLLETSDPFGNWSTEDPTTYRYDPFVGDPRQIEVDDAVQLVPGQYLSNGLINWPATFQAARITGSFGWNVCPDRAKRAIALMTFDIAKPTSNSLNRATSWQTADAIYQGANTSPTGIPEADEIIAALSRARVLAG